MNIATIIVISIIASLIVTLLVALLLYAKAKLSPSGTVKLKINGEKEIEVSPGSSLLSTLSNEKIFLPSACGGGTCGMCKCRVTSGGGEIPTEVGFFTRKQQQTQWRLGCHESERGYGDRST